MLQMGKMRKGNGASEFKKKEHHEAAFCMNLRPSVYFFYNLGIKIADVIKHIIFENCNIDF